MEQKIAGLIPSRLESTRLPRKALADIGGRPMTGLLVERLKTCTTLSDICLCTVDSPANQELVQKTQDWGIHSNLGKKNDLLGNMIAAARKLGAEHFVRITGDNPFTDPVYINTLVKAHLEHGAEYSRIDGLPVGVSAEVIALKAATRLHQESPGKEALGYLTLYMYDPARFRCLVMDAAPQHSRPTYSLTVDTPRDLEMIRKIIEAFPHGPDLQQIIGWLDTHPAERIEIDSTSAIKIPGEKTLSYSAFSDEMRNRKNRSQILLAA